MKPIPFTLLSVLFVAGCGPNGTPPKNAGADGSPAPSPKETLAEARRGFHTKLVRHEAEHEPAPAPPPKLFTAVRYDSPAGKLAAYVSPPPGDGKRHPAIVWIFGGFSNSIGDDAWEPAPPDNDQSAAAFRKAGLLMMYPSRRGGNDNPGFKEGLFGEVDDVLAAADYLARLDYVDPNRIYLGGHSTGGTLALLAAESTDRFRAVFSFGPVDDVNRYGAESLPFDTRNPRELELRAPGRWLDAIRSPTYVFEGMTKGNSVALFAMSRASKNPLIHFHPVIGATHFTILAPTTALVARKIVQDDGTVVNIAFTTEELSRPFAR